MTIHEITGLMRDPKPEDIALIERAWTYAEKAHQNQKRLSGEPYFIHAFYTAKILAEFRADVETIAAGLLHDVQEDGGVANAELRKEFGPNIAFLVEGVTKLGKLKYQGVVRHVESLRKLFVATAEDIRVILIRLADRLHNVQTLKYVPPDKQKRVALETLEIYAPIANRLGIWRLKGLLEDAAFPYAYPEQYQQVAALRKTKGRETLRRLTKICRTLERTLAERGLTNFTTDYRIKYLYSLWSKLKRRNMNIEEVYDISALRVIVDTIPDCYLVLGVAHGLWRPAPGTLKDYIATPKPNGYQSIHTGVVMSDGAVVEIQIRTKDMQYEAEFGFAAHIFYDESGKPEDGGKISRSLQWVQELIGWQKHLGDHEEYLQSLKTDFFQDRIFVFTPQGDVIELPAEATPIDFAYYIHSDIGDHASGAIINGKFAGLEHRLKNGDTIFVETKKTNQPTAKWLTFVKTINAKRHIRSHLAARASKS